MSPVGELNRTKKRLQNLRRKSFSLQQHAVREISKQLTFYLTHPDELEKLKKLPGALRDKILQVLMKKRCLDMQGQEMEFENLKDIFPLLLSSKTHYIELNGILSFCPDWYQSKKFQKVTQWCVVLLRQIAILAPEVETLVIKRNNPLYIAGLCNYFNDGNFHQGMVQALMKMQRLNRLHVNLYYFQLTDLLKICKNLPRLQYLNVEFSSHRGKDKPAPEEISSCFCNLKELIFEFPFNDWLGSLCTRNLPNIEVVQYDPNKIMNWTHVRQYGKRYHDVDFPGASNLRHICVDLSRSCAAELEAMPNFFPNVTCLMVTNNSCSSLATDVKPKFDNIRNLHLFISSGGEELFDNYLITYGQNLQSLYLGHDRALTIDVEMIFKNCPILEKLSLQNVQLDWPLIEIKCFAELKELEWEINCLDGFRDSESMVLCYILSSPNLEKVKLESKGFNQNDLRILHSLIREKRILNNLHTLHVYFNFQMDVALANVLKSACAFLPKLTDFKFGNRCKFADPLKACQTTPLSDVDAHVWEMIRVFENEN